MMHQPKNILMGGALTVSIAMGLGLSLAAIAQTGDSPAKPSAKGASAATKWADIDKWPDFTTGSWSTGMGVDAGLRPNGPPAAGSSPPAGAPPPPPPTDRSGLQTAPLKPEIAAKIQAAIKRSGPGGSGSPSCEPDGVVTNPGAQFFFAKDVIIIAGEQGPSNIWRRVYMNRKTHDDPEPTYYGDSIGHWEGATLVVDTVGIRAEAKLGQGVPLGSYATHLVERFHLKDPNTLEIVRTVENPDIFIKPWVNTTVMKRIQGEQFNEAFCWRDREDSPEQGPDFTPPK